MPVWGVLVGWSGEVRLGVFLVARSENLSSERGFCCKRHWLCTGCGGPAGVCSGFPLLSVAVVSVVIKNQASVVFDTSGCERLQCLEVSTLVGISLPVVEGSQGLTNVDKLYNEILLQFQSMY